MSVLKTKAAKGVKFTSISVGVVSLLQLVQLIVLGRLLGPEVFGLIALVQIVIQFSQMMMDMGITDAIIHKEKIGRKALSSLYWFSILAGSVMFGLLLLLAPVIASAFQAPELTVVIQVVGISFVILPFGLQFQTIATKKLDFKDIAKYEVFANVTGVAVTISSVLVFGTGIWSVVFGYLTTAAVRTVPWVVIGFRDEEMRPALEFSWNAMKELVSFGLYRLGTTTANYVNTKIDQIIIGIMLGPQILGFYSMAINLVMQPIQKLNPMITKVSLPIFSKIQNDRARLKKWYLFIIHLIMVMNAPLFAGLAVLAPYAVPLLLGDEWGSIILLVQILCGYALFRSLGNPSGSLFIAVGKVRWSFYWQLSLLLVVPAVVYSSSLTGNIMQVAMSMAVLRLILFFINYALRIRLIIGDCLKELIKTIAVPIAHSAVMVVLLQGLLQALASLDIIPLVALSVLCGAVIYTALVWIFEKDLMNELKGLVKKRKFSQAVDR